MKQKKTSDIIQPLDIVKVKQRLRVLHTKGLTSAEIAAECSMSVSLVHNLFKEMGYKENPERSKEKHIWADSCHYKSKELRKRYGD